MSIVMTQDMISAMLLQGGNLTTSLAIAILASRLQNERSPNGVHVTQQNGARSGQKSGKTFTNLMKKLQNLTTEPQKSKKKNDFLVFS